MIFQLQQIMRYRVVKLKNKKKELDEKLIFTILLAFNFPQQKIKIFEAYDFNSRTCKFCLYEANERNIGSVLRSVIVYMKIFIL